MQAGQHDVISAEWHPQLFMLSRRGGYHVRLGGFVLLEKGASPFARGSLADFV